MAFSLPSLNAHAPGAKERAEEALVANLWKTLIKSSGVLGGDSGWEGMAHDAFAEAVANAVGKTGPGLMPERHAPDPDTPGAFALPPARTSHGSSAHDHTPVSPEAMKDLLGLVDGQAHISSPFGRRRDPLGDTHRQHDGIDIAAPLGAAIRSAGDGVVTRAEKAGGYGLLVEILHQDGTRSRYAHASRLLVKEGQQIRAGEAIAEVGETGRATGPHLHFEVREGSAAINPVRALKTYKPRVDSHGEQRLSSGGPNG